MTNKPNWKKGDIIALLKSNGGNVSIFQAKHDPKYCSAAKTWYYGMRNCNELRLATHDDVERNIEIQIKEVEREQSRLDELFRLKVNMIKNI